MSRKRLKPPDDLSDEALLEWQRICSELAKIGKLEATYRPLLVVYVKTWAIWHYAVKKTERLGPVIKYSNGVSRAKPIRPGGV